MPLFETCTGCSHIVPTSRVLRFSHRYETAVAPIAIRTVVRPPPSTEVGARSLIKRDLLWWSMEGFSRFFEIARSAGFRFRGVHRRWDEVFPPVAC